MQPDLLRVETLSVSFGTESGPARVLDGVNLRVGAGEIVGLVGESGCGKTTLARAILGVLPPNASVRGTLAFDGQDLLAMSAARAAERIRGRLITFVPQDPFGSFSPLFTIGDQIADLLRWKSPDPATGRSRRRRDRERAIAMLRAVQLPDPAALLRRYPHELSGGQRQRVMIAMALLPEPKLVIADEPTTALDVTIQAQILKLLRDLATRSGASVLFTTHDLGTAWEICDRVVVMYAGQEAEAAGVDGFFERPAHPYTRALLQSLPQQGRALEGIPGSVPSPFAPPPGCRFHPRCPRASTICAQLQPGEDVIEPGHLVRCHHPVPGAGAHPPLPLAGEGWGEGGR